MKSIATLITLFAALGVTVFVGAQSPPPKTALFSVDFQGIIVHTKIESPSKDWRSVLIAGDFGRQHTPTLAIVAPTDPKKRRNLIIKLRDVTGKLPRCPNDQCFVAIHGVSMRIRGNKKPPKGTLVPDPSFRCLAPHLSYPPISGGKVLRDAEVLVTGQRAHLPSAPAVAFFEIEGGTLLSASKFEMSGYLKDTDFEVCLARPESEEVCLREAREKFRRCIADGHPESQCAEHTHCREFAAGVHWEGETEDPARLEMASNLTAWQWEEIPIENAGPLMLYVENLADSGHVSSEHFSMMAKLLVNKHIPVIGFGCTGDPDVSCAEGPGPGAILAVPGCADNQWP